MYVCVCATICADSSSWPSVRNRRNTQVLKSELIYMYTYISVYIHIYVYIYMCECYYLEFVALFFKPSKHTSSQSQLATKCTDFSSRKKMN